MVMAMSTLTNLVMCRKHACANYGHDSVFERLNYILQTFGVILVYPCDSSPCKNGGSCENAENTFNCTCTERYEGDTCENRGLFLLIFK